MKCYNVIIFEVRTIFFTISSLRYRDLIIPKNTYSIDLGCNEIAILIVDNRVTVNDIVVKSGDVVIGGKYQLYNTGVLPINVSGFTLRLNDIVTSTKITKVIRNNELDNEILSILELLDTSASYQLIIEKINSVIPKLSGLIKSHYYTKMQEVNPKIDRRLIIINRYIRKNYSEPITLQTLADLIQCNPVYLSNTYSRVFKITPIKYLQNYRMKKAEQMLIHSNSTIGNIANILGYVSCSQFSFIFKRYYKLTPSQYRMEYALEKLNLNEGGI